MPISPGYDATSTADFTRHFVVTPTASGPGLPGRRRPFYNGTIRITGRVAIIVLLIAVSASAALAFRLLLHVDVVYAHFMYVPIALACMWWGKRGIIVAAVLAALVISMNLVGLGSGSLPADAVRGAFFLVVATFIGVLQERLTAGRVALERTETDHRRLIEQSLIGIFVYAEGRVVFANTQFSRMIGVEPSMAPGTPLDGFIHVQDAQRFGSEILRTPRSEYRFLRADNATLLVEAAGSPTTWEGREAVLVNVIDITGRREAEELARKQEEQLVHSTRLAELGEMAAAISHELNQPLTGIRNYARNAFYMIEKHLGGEEEVKGNLRLISEQVDRASKIINEMRELTRRSDRQSTPLDVNGVIRESVEFLLPQMRLSGVETTLELSGELPLIRGDRIRLAQVFLNLLTNARHAMEEAPERRLCIRSHADADSPRSIVVEVSDTGKGFTEEESRMLFAPFYTTKKSGHGLGLSISRAIVQEHKGTIQASGSPGKGAVFTIRLPAETPEEAGRRTGAGSAHG